MALNEALARKEGRDRDKYLIAPLGSLLTLAALARTLHRAASSSDLSERGQVCPALAT